MAMRESEITLQSYKNLLIHVILRFVCDLYFKTMQMKLLSESDLTPKKAFEIAVGMENAERESNEFRNEVPTSTHKVTVVECYRCSKSGHRADDCYYKKSKCHQCKETGHLSCKCKKNHTVYNLTRERRSSRRNTASQLNLRQNRRKFTKLTKNIPNHPRMNRNGLCLLSKHQIIGRSR